MKYILKTNKLLINSPESPHSAFIYTGSPNEGQKDKGKLVVLLDFPKDTKNPKELGNLLIQKIHKLYYKSTLLEQEAILENILEEVNENLPIIAEIDNNWAKKFNAVIAIIYRQEVYFSPLGNVSAWTTNNNKLINIFDYLESNIDKPTVDKIFTNILSGNIEPNQLLFFTTNSMFNHLTKDKIKKIIINNEPASIILKFKELLNKIKTKNFCLVSIKLSQYTPQQKNEKIKKATSLKKEKQEGGININISPQESIDHLLQSQQATEEILSKGKSSVINTEKKPDLDDIDITDIQKNKNKQNFNKYLVQSFKTYFSILGKIFKAVYNFFRDIILTIKKRIARISIPKIKIPNKISPPAPLPNKAMKKINGGKNIIIIAIILLIAFASSILIMNNKKKLELEKEKYEQILQNIDEKQEEYDLLLIYNDSGQAKNKLEEISQLINQLPQRTEEQKSKYNEILDKFTETLNQTRKLNTIKNPEIIAELDFSPEKIIKDGNNLIAIGKDSHNLVSLDLKTKEIKSISSTEINYDNILNFSKDGNFIYGLKENDRVIKIDLINQTAQEITITYHPNHKQADDLMVYGGRIYILDSQNNQIYKHNQGTISFGKGEEWIQDGTDIQNAQALTIDGNIYIATNKGEIKKFYTGNSVKFDIEEIDPQIKNIDQIFTDTTINEIYFLDNNSKRVIIINKDGVLINQFYLPTLATMTDFIVDGAAQKVYIQSDNKIVSLNLN
jgi:hypothetical protein